MSRREPRPLPGYPKPAPPPSPPPAPGREANRDTTEALLLALQSVSQNLRALTGQMAALDVRLSEVEAMLSDDDDQPEPELYLNGTRRN